MNYSEGSSHLWNDASKTWQVVPAGRKSSK